MKDEDKTKEQLIKELAGLRQRVAKLETLESERKRAEEALRESEERFRNLTEYLPGVSIQGYRPDGTLFYWNKASEKI